MIITNRPADVDFHDSKLNSFRKSFAFPAPLNTLAGWTGWGAEVRFGSEPLMTLTRGGNPANLSISSEGKLLWTMSQEVLNRARNQPGYELVLIAPDGTRKHYLSGKFSFIA